MEGCEWKQLGRDRSDGGRYGRGVEKPIRKKSSQGRGTALGMNPMMRGGSSHHKAMRRLEREEKRLWSRIKRIKRIVGSEESTRSRRSRSEPVEGSREAE